MFRRIAIAIADPGTRVSDNRDVYRRMVPWLQLLSDSDDFRDCLALFPNKRFLLKEDQTNGVHGVHIPHEFVASKELPTRIRELRGRADLVVLDARFDKEAKTSVLDAAFSLRVPVVILSVPEGSSPLVNENSFVVFSSSMQGPDWAAKVALQIKRRAQLNRKPRLVARKDCRVNSSEFDDDYRDNPGEIVKLQDSEQLIVFHSDSPPTISEINSVYDEIAPKKVAVAHLITSHNKRLNLDLEDDMRASCDLSMSYFALLLISTVIASMGLIHDSETVVIGAMVIAPMMNPLLGGAYFAYRKKGGYVAKAAAKLLLSIVSVVAIAYWFGLTNDNTVTQALAARCEYQLNPIYLIAAGSALAAVVACCESRRASAVPGVAIAVALVPPLATAGILMAHGRINLALWAWQVAYCNAIIIFATAVIAFACLRFSALSRLSLVFDRLGVHSQALWNRCTRDNPFWIGAGSVLLMLLPFLMIFFNDNGDTEKREALRLILSDKPLHPAVTIDIGDTNEELLSRQDFETKSASWTSTDWKYLEIRQVHFQHSVDPFLHTQKLLAKYDGLIQGVRLSPHQFTSFLEAQIPDVQQLHIHGAGERDLQMLLRAVGDDVWKVGVYSLKQDSYKNLSDFELLLKRLPALKGLSSPRGRLIVEKQFNIDIKKLLKKRQFGGITRISHQDDEPLLTITLTSQDGPDSTDADANRRLDARFAHLRGLPFDSLAFDFKVVGDTAAADALSTANRLFSNIKYCGELRNLEFNWDVGEWVQSADWSFLGELKELHSLVVSGQGRLPDKFVGSMKEHDNIRVIEYSSNLLTPVQIDEIKAGDREDGEEIRFVPLP